MLLLKLVVGPIDILDKDGFRGTPLVGRISNLSRRRCKYEITSWNNNIGNAPLLLLTIASACERGQASNINNVNFTIRNACVSSTLLPVTFPAFFDKTLTQNCKNLSRNSVPLGSTFNSLVTKRFKLSYVFNDETPGCVNTDHNKFSTSSRTSSVKAVPGIAAA